MLGTPAPGSPCPTTHFACKNNQCVRKVDVCDGEIDCIDGSDEQVCSKFHSVVLLNSKQRSDNFLPISSSEEGSHLMNVTYMLILA